MSETLPCVSGISFGRLVLEAETPVLVEFGAETCSGCRALRPVVERFAERHPEIAVFYCDVDTDPSLARLHGITALPTTALFRAGKLVSCVIGYQGDPGLEALLDAPPGSGSDQSEDPDTAPPS